MVGVPGWRRLGLAVCLCLCLCMGGLAASPVRAQDDHPIIEITPGKARSFRAAVQRFADPGEAVGSERLVELKTAVEGALHFNRVLEPLPEAQCPMPEFLRAQYALPDGVARAAADPVLLEHRDAVYRDHLELPLDF